MMSITRSNQKGFTLVELLIVVAIAGILAVVGIPQFRRMVMKSRKVEAKQALGALYAANSAFFSEYNTYGSNLTAIGFQMDAGPGGRRYSVGFTNPDCTGIAGGIPQVGNGAPSDNLNTLYPAYYDAFTADITLSQVDHACSTGTFGQPGAVCMTACDDVTLRGGGVDATGQSYVASATGYIRPYGNSTGQAATIDAAVIGNMDIWTMNENRDLSNVQEGVN